MKTPLELLRDDVSQRFDKAQEDFVSWDWQKNDTWNYENHDRLERKRDKLLKFLDRLDIMLEDIKFNLLED